LANIVYAPAKEVVYPDNARRLDFTARIPYFLTELKRTGVTRLLLWEEYRKENNNPYRYTQFCILLKEASKVTQATMHLVHTPAAMVMIDFAGDKMSYVDRSTGELIFCPVLVCVLPFSKYTFAIALADATIPQVIKALNSCLQYLGGVPLSLKTDNMKQVVTKSCRYEPVTKPKAMGCDYNITLLTTRAADPAVKVPEKRSKDCLPTYLCPFAMRSSSFNQLNAAVQNNWLCTMKTVPVKTIAGCNNLWWNDRCFNPRRFACCKHRRLPRCRKLSHHTWREPHHYSVLTLLQAGECCI
jgi:hypothetical protein